jgi:indole-3-glycerol phosphate synthase
MRVKNAVKLPVLRKDFIIDESQIYESRFAGADAILLISRILTPLQLEHFQKIATNIGLQCLIEVDTSNEASIAFELGAEIIGINNRDLDSLTIDLNRTRDIIKAVPELTQRIIVSESGIKSREDVESLRSVGVKAVLVGESILKSGNMPEKIRELLGDIS